MSSLNAESVRELELEEISSKQVLEWLEADEIVLVDVRETSEYQQEHIPGAVLYPLSMFEADLFPNFKDKLVVLHCAVGKRSAAAAKQLLKAGFSHVANLSGGLSAWKEAGCPTEVQQNNPNGTADLPMLISAGNEGENVPVVVEGEGVHPGQILQIEFMAPLGINVSQLAKAIAVSDTAITDLIDGNSNVDAQLALRLSRYLCTSNEFWLRLQLAHDLEQARKIHSDTIRRQVQPRRANCSPSRL